MLDRWARRIARKRSVILCYHGVGPTSARTDPGYLRISPDAFRRQLELLLAGGFRFVTVSEWARRAAGAKPPPGLAALSFDDGMDDNRTVVMPILQEYGLQATFYVTTGLIGEPNPWMAPGASRMMTVPELVELAAAGFEIGAHTVTHPDLSELGFDDCLREIRESRSLLEQALGVRIRTFAYPFCQYGPAARAAVEAAELESAVTCGTDSGSWDVYELPRAIVTGKDGINVFLLKIAGLHGPVFSSAPGRAIRALTRRYRFRRRVQREGRPS